MTTDQPPAFEGISAIELQSAVDSKIIAVSLYSTRAEITRLYRFVVQTGLNQVSIEGLPSVLETESLRVEGRGAATIHDVTVSRDTTEGGDGECAGAVRHLDGVPAELPGLAHVLENTESIGARLDAKKAELTEELQFIDAEIAAERSSLQGPPQGTKLRSKAVIGVFAQAAGNVEIALIYGVYDASWRAFYDIRADMNAKENPVTLIYRADVTQNTGELETATPTSGMGFPKLSPWNLQIYRETYGRLESHSRGRGVPRSLRARPKISRESYDPEEEEEGLPMGFMPYGVASVTSKGYVNATFRVPGVVTIPCDGEAHKFTITELNPKAVMSWVAVPKLDAKTHLSARLTNASEYTLLEGSASVYVDGSFISRTSVPSVSPQESFNCSFGLDPSIRITYHPLSKKLSTSGVFSKSANYVFAQRITVHNTKGVGAQGVKIVDQIPASQDEKIEVRLVSPALRLPVDSGASANASSGKTAKEKEPQVLNVAKGVVAQWDGSDEPGCEVEALGQVNWICAVPAQGKVNLALEWEVTVSPPNAQVVGL
ncbi:hypothetical protein DFH07DRAFT_951451 [Mycena maculata]|uniref:Mucoidy inhibitor A n=1 Tax=Mycena maculata TaxID=230809 RepID=A0AAD7K283_9AGAR|nr:hypothetical protein DFH07DRAFT_951451 [Mycena maculata]